MSAKDIVAYRNGLRPVPGRMLRWHLYGAGLENMGRDGAPEEVNVPEFGASELLVRQDACGLCFSDTKVIGLGANHPRMTGRNLAEDPVTLGHEVSVTVVGVGESLEDRFHVGDRFVVQADVFYKGKSMAYGYAISGGLAEYSIIPTAVIDGDEGCYLLPVHAETGYVESALTEPWACVVSAYAQTHRSGPRQDGTTLVVCGSNCDEIEQLFAAGHQPGRIVVAGADETISKSISDRITNLGVAVETRVSAQWPDAAGWQEIQKQAGNTFDDIIVLLPVPAHVIESVSSTIADHGIIGLIGESEVDRKLSLDIGRIHYNWRHYLGAATSSGLFDECRSADLLPGGITWIIGAGGPMGQMHVQRAVLHRSPPRRIVCTDVDAVRLSSVSERFGPDAARRGVELVTLNPAEFSEAEYNAEIGRLGDNRGYDDILSMVPAAALIEHAADFLASGGWFNIFAGVARGTLAKLDVNRIVRDRVRYLGSSGSSLSDMRETLSRVEERELSTNSSLAAIGGMQAAREGLQAVKEGWFPGKTLIFPLIHDLPLTPLPQLKDGLPSVYAKLKDGKFWTNEAEEELLSIYLA